MLKTFLFLALLYMSDALGIALVLGFYDRKNIGDECFKLAFKKALRGYELRFRCMDDATPDYVAFLNPVCVIIGGGDIINDYFMRKARIILADYKGRIYGLSIGIPFESCKHYLDMFDHVFMRSARDAQIASEYIGDENVTQIVDLSTCLDVPAPSLTIDGRIRIGVCLAQPLFYNNEHTDSIMLNMITCMKSCVENLQNTTHRRVEWHFLPFNYNYKNTTECDDVAIARFVALAKQEKLEGDIHVVNAEYFYYLPASEMLDYFRSLDMNICMRYHSMMYSIITGKPFLALYSSSKIRNCLEYLPLNNGVGIEFELDPVTYLPMAFDDRAFMTKLQFMLRNQEFVARLALERRLLMEQQNIEALTRIYEVIQGNKVKTVITYRPLYQNIGVTFDEVVDRCVGSLSRFCNMSKSHIQSLVDSQGVRWTEVLPSADTTVEDMARLICFCVSKSLDDPCYWGLLDALKTRDICLRESIEYIWNHHATEMSSVAAKIKVLPRDDILVNIDPHITTTLTSLESLHRSGWGYVMKGLMSMDAKLYGRKSNIIIDSFVDRTFHWSCNTLEMFGVLPFQSPWFGFVHHTFDETHSTYNCVNLFKNTYFIESLPKCKGLIALSSYLASQLRNALETHGYASVPVYVMCHAMEIPPLTFDMNAFVANTDRAMVHIGAWLRDPYPFYTLDLSTLGYPLKKKALKGKNMDLYFPPRGYSTSLDKIHEYLNAYTESDTVQDICRDIHNICRDDICRDVSKANKFLIGVKSMLQKQFHSVEIVERLSNDAYDALLRENIVFLHLVDCSAVNTVLECIVRNTPIIVNRHPALEELLGTEYPGFYSSIPQVPFLCDSFDKIKAMHVYLTRLDKSKYDIQLFLTRLKEIVRGTADVEMQHVLVDSNTIQQENQVFRNKFRSQFNMDRFLPTRYTQMV